MKLLPGMPVLAGWMGEWIPAEIISVRSDHFLLIKYSPPRKELLVRSSPWVAIDTPTLEAGQKAPSNFKPSVRTLPQGLRPLPDDLEPVTESTPLVPGTPLKAERGLEWEDLTVAELRSNGHVRVYRDKIPSAAATDMDRNALAISRTTLEQLKQPDAVKKFKEKAESLENSIERKAALRRSRKRYPITLSLPDDTEKVTRDMALEVGTPLAAQWGQSWYDLTVKGLNKDGTVFVHWNKFSDHWDEDLERDDLIISKRELARLKPAAPAMDSSQPPPSRSSSQVGRYRVIVREIGPHKIQVSKVVAELTGLELKDALDFVEALPFPVKQNLTKTEAEKVQKQLEEAGAKVSLELK
ncbi:MAG: ribosomal protein L7/L12 [Planctomycetales bacterium]